jgi:hypothetical protein
VPRLYGFVLEDKGFHRLAGWNEAVDDPLPITIETTQKLLSEREKDFMAFLAAHREGIIHAKGSREKVVQLLISKFGHHGSLAEKTFDDYIGYMDESLKIDHHQMVRLLAQLAGDKAADAKQIVSDWAIPSAVKAS